MLRRRVEYRVFLIALVLLFTFQTVIIASADISGSVRNQDGASIVANIQVYEEKIETASFQTGPNGDFSIETPPGNYTLIVYADEPETPGFDYLPAAVNVPGDFDGEIVLGYGSTLSFVGDIQFVDTENIPLKTTYSVLDDSGNLIIIRGFPLQFSDKRGIEYVIPILSPKDIILPADSIVDINVSSSILVETQVAERSFLIHDFTSPSQGEISYIDVRLYTIPISQSITSDTLEKLNTQLNTMNKFGFYLAKQETALSNGIKNVESSETYYANEDFDTSFGSLKRGYILFTHTNTELLNMFRDAKFSVYLLIAFLTVASLITGYLLIDDFFKQVIVDTLILGGSLIFFYYTYPGSRTIPLARFILSSTVFLVAFLAAGSIFPLFFTGGGSDGRVHTRNLISPIFNMAKRSLRRRRVRFLLTFISISLLVMSFVTLTSFSEGYGLIKGESSPKVGWSGAYIREGTWSSAEPTFILVDNVELNWLIGQPETDLISQKAESTPLRSPMFLLEGQPIFGVIGVSNNELAFLDLDDTLITGNLPSENGVLISESFSETTQLEIGDIIVQGSKEYIIDGIFDDESFRRLKDLDGTPYVSNKWINVSPEGETPNWVLEESEPDEILVMNTQQAVRFPTVGIQRIAVKINPEFNATGFAERLALERGYLSWANTVESYTSYRLGNYFQGKGATLIIPWAIVVLNVVVTMLNSLFERRNEIEILSSVGLNPAQVSSIFVAEAAITGFIAGGLGYLVGLGFYKALAILNIGLQVHQKVSAIWSFAAIGLAISAVITGAFAALQNSVVITPSLMRRWRLDRSTGGFQEPWRIDIPIKLEPAELTNYLDFVESKLHTLENHPTHVTSSIKQGENMLEFVYKSYQTTTGNFYTKNTLKLFPLEKEDYGAVLESLGETEWVHVVGSLVRQITMDYSTDKRG